MRSTTKISTRLLLGIALVGSAACGAGSDGTGGSPAGTEPPDTPKAPASISGTYPLRLVNGGPLPALLWYDQTADHMDAEMCALSGSIVLRPDGTYRHTSVSSLTIEGVGDQVWTSINDGTYSFTPDPGTVEGEGIVTFTGENGGQGTMLFSPIDYTLLQHTTIPGAVGQPDVPVTMFYRR
jgi:hypothetical protein